jgi:hypothetical protein
MWVIGVPDRKEECCCCQCGWLRGVDDVKNSVKKRLNHYVVFHYYGRLRKLHDAKKEDS